MDSENAGTLGKQLTFRPVTYAVERIKGQLHIMLKKQKATLTVLSR